MCPCTSSLIPFLSNGVIRTEPGEWRARFEGESDLPGGTGPVRTGRWGACRLAGDSLLIQRALQGDADAFAQLVAKYHRQVFNLAYRLTGNKEDAMDVTQETMLRAYRALPSFNEGADFLPWVYRIAWNICADRGRKRRRSPATVSLEANESETRTLPAPDSSPDEDVEKEELRRILDAAISRLEEGYRELIVMFHVDGLSIKEISEITGLKDTVIKNRLYRGRRKLKQILLESGYRP